MLTRFANIYLTAAYKLQMAPTADYQNKEMCAKCGGKCCSTYPGLPSPEQFGAPDKEKMTDVLIDVLIKPGKNRRYVIDYWDQDDQLATTYFVRPKITYGDELPEHIKKRMPALDADLVSPGYGGQCTFKGSAGCELGHDERPVQCKTLKPISDMKCENDLSKIGIIKKWIPYQGVLKKIQRMQY